MGVADEGNGYKRMRFETANERWKSFVSITDPETGRTSEDSFFKSVMSILFANLTPQNISYDSAKHRIYQQLENDQNIIATMGEYPDLENRVRAAVEEKLNTEWRQRQLTDERHRKRNYLD